jgi:GxxExxY protein
VSDFLANCAYFEEEYNYNQVIKLPTPKSKGAGADEDGEGPVVTDGVYDHLPERLNMDIQDAQDKELKYEQITKTVIGCAFEVINELGAGFLESVYQNAMLLALRQMGISVTPQRPISVMFRGESVGDFYADLFVEEKIIVELKAVKAIAPEHQAQIINYLNATGIEVGLLINFGNPRLEYKQKVYAKKGLQETTGHG